MRKLLRLLVTLAIAAPASAALPPHHQRIAELKAVLGDPAVVRAFETIPIERLEHVGPDLYRVSAGRCRLDVAIVDLPTPANVSGGRRFAVRPGRKVCGR